ncbi:unnamed protein product [Scytosiphon promiscuus]
MLRPSRDSVVLNAATPSCHACPSVPPGPNHTPPTRAQVVQGSKTVATRRHRLRLECSPFFRRDFQWTAVDLDYWMKGNTFW